MKTILICGGYAKYPQGPGAFVLKHISGNRKPITIEKQLPQVASNEAAEIQGILYGLRDLIHPTEVVVVSGYLPNPTNWERVIECAKANGHTISYSVANWFGERGQMYTDALKQAKALAS
jgi:hypothetical protein